MTGLEADVEPTDSTSAGDQADPSPASRRAALAERFRASGRSRASGHRHLLTGSTMLVIGAAVQGLGGMIFSLIVAQWDTKDAFGDASALFTSVLFVTYLAGLGLPIALARYAGDRSEDSHVVFTWGMIATAIASVVAAAGYLGIVSPKAAHVLSDWNSVGGFVLFAVIVTGSAFSLIFDVRAMTMRRWNLVLIRIALVAVAKIALLPLGRQAADRPLLLFLYLAGPVAISGFLGMGLVNRMTGGRHRLGPRPASARAATRYSAINWVSQLAYQAPYFALPVIVLVHVDSSTNSSFYVAWGIVAIAFYVPSAIGQALLAEGGKDGAQIRAQMRLAMTLAIGLMAAGTVVTFLAKGVVTAAYGEGYRESAHILPAMMLAGIPWAVSSLYLTEARVMHRHVSTVIITLTLTGAIVVPALILVPRDGLDGASRAWLVGNVIAAVVATITTWAGRRSNPTATAVADLDPLLAAPV